MSPEPDRRRPLLAGGERLTEEIKRTQGGGPKTHPRTMEQAVELLAPQLRRLQTETAETPAHLRGSRVVFEATVSPNYLANSYFPKELFAEADLVPVGTRGAVGIYETPKRAPEKRETKTYLLAGDERSLSRVNGLLHDDRATRGAAGRAREELRQFELVQLPSPEETLRRLPESPAHELIVWEAVFHPLADRRGRYSEDERLDVLAKWQAHVERLGGAIENRYIRTVKGLTFMPVRLPAEAGAEAARFNPLRAIRPMPAVRPIPVSPLRVNATIDTPAEPPAGERAQSDLRVGVFDGGVDESVPHLAGFVRDHDLTGGEPADENDVRHGTMVSSTILYGADQEHGQLPTPEVEIDCFRVVPIPAAERGVDLFWILDRIVDRAGEGQYPLVNLSIGPELSVEEDEEPHAWTAVLDELAARNGTTFVTAIGNNGRLDAASGANRLQVPGDMANGIGVGACDRRAPEDWARAPYSPLGPGRPGGRMQPLGLAFGGVDGRLFRAITSGGVIGEASGTSFSAPLATHGLAGLAATLGDPVGIDPSVLRAFAAHGAEGCDPSHAAESGFGRLLERYDEMLECQPYEATVLYRETISRDQTISMAFPLVTDILAGRMVSLKWTIAFVASTDPENAVEYTTAGLEVAFRPHANRFTFSNREQRRSAVVDVVEDRDRATALLGEGFLPSTLPATRRPETHRHEALLRAEEAKWETINRCGDRMRASGLHRPQITVSYLAREEGMLRTGAPPLEFAMLLTMTGPKDVALYDAVRTGFQQLVPVRTELPLRISV
jgi:hypothetical protein